MISFVLILLLNGHATAIPGFKNENECLNSIKKIQNEMDHGINFISGYCISQTK